MIHFLQSTIEKKQSVSDQLTTLEMYSMEIAKGSYPFKRFYYEMHLKGVRFPISIHTYNSIKPIFHFIKKSIQCFFRCEHILTESVCYKAHSSFSDVTVSETGLINHKGRVYWSLSSAVFRGKVLKVYAVKLISGKYTLIMYDGDTYLGHAEEISNP